MNFLHTTIKYFYSVVDGWFEVSVSVGLSEWMSTLGLK